MKSFTPLRFVPVIILAVFFPVALFIFGSPIMDMPTEYELTALTDNWTITINDITYSDASISDVKFGRMQKGQTISLIHVIPYTEIENPCLYFTSHLYVVNAYIDGEIVYSCGNDLYALNKMIPDYHNSIHIDKDNQGKNIEIILTASEDTSFGGFNSFYYGSMKDIYHSYIQEIRLAFYIGMFLVIFFAFLLILAPFILTSSEDRDISIIFTAYTSFCLGTYILAYNGFFSFYTDSPVLFPYFRYVPLYFTPFFTICFYLTSMERKATMYDNAIVLINLIFPILAIILHFANIVHICQLLVTSHAILLISSLYMTYRLFNDIKSNITENNEFNSNTSSTILLIGIFIVTGSSFIDIFRLYVRKLYHGNPDDHSGVLFVIFGAIGLVLCIVINYFVHCLEHINSTRIKEHLKGIAYSDTLTGLANRARCEQMLAELSYSKKAYTIISLDLDHLKQVNDSLGHHQGDLFIQGFADILKNVFAKADLIGRMGGDEFIIIMYGDQTEFCPELFRNLREAMDEKNKSESTFTYSASWGFAATDEDVKSSAKDIYMIADSRMYAMKQRHHSATLKRIYSDLKSALMGGGINNEH
ncbi:MAG: GGDEF domain-containing protein [Lachnospiraceae bacterium]|nr:GGDEF domain-containing protein [Lachnospiraceae bacterium]